MGDEAVGRKPLGKKLRFEVFKRDRFVCRYCGQTPPEVVLEIDHIIPLAAGGTNEVDNLVTACFPCNRGKGANGLGKVVPVLDELAVREGLQEIAERRMLLEQQKAGVEARREAQGYAFDTVVEWWEDATNCPGRPFLEKASVVRFADRIGLEELFGAIQSTARWWERSGFNTPAEHAAKYFYKICWERIRELEA
jgi:hypothetical protein